MLRIFLVSLTIAFSTHSAELSLYAIKSPKVVNWKSPQTLLISTLKSYLRIGNGRNARREIGHAFVGIKCDGDREILSGMTSTDDFQGEDNLLKKKHGMSILIQDNPGRIESHEEVLREIMDLSKAFRINALKIEISESQCQEMKDWYEEYSSRPKLIYGGLDKRPLKGEGSGCTAYAMSFFEYADVDFDYFKEQFQRTIYIPRYLMGGEQGDGKKVSIWKLLKNRTRLARPNFDSLKLDLFDANDMYFWIQNKWVESRRNKEGVFEKYKASTGLFNKMKILSLKKK